MRKLIIKLGSRLILIILSLRYKIEIKGLNKLIDNGKKNGVLILPNHPAEIDPIIIHSIIAPIFFPRPLVIAHFYYMKGARFFMNLVKALPMPNFEISANSWKLNQLKKSLNQVETGLKSGENFLIYPSGHLKQQGHENIGGNSFIHNLLETSPNVQVVLIRISGLWGSSFSRAITGHSPDFWKIIKQGIKIGLKNFVFFTPRRRVSVEFELAGDSFPHKDSRLRLNQYLENWYNRYLSENGKRIDSEPLKLVSFSAYSNKFPDITKESKEKKEKKDLNINPETRRDIYNELKKLSGIDEITDQMDLARDIGLDSLDIANIHAFLDKKYDVASATPGQLHTVYDLLELIAKNDYTQPKVNLEKPLKNYWPDEVQRPNILPPEGATIPEAVLSICKRMGGFVACGDDLSKIMTYKELKIKIMVIALKLKTIPDKYIGLMLPSSVGCYVVILGILFAGKIPVMLNWTSGERSLTFSRDSLDIRVILSSRKFLEKVEILEIGDLEDQILLLEDFRQKISFWDKISGFVLAHKSKKSITKWLKLDNIQKNDPAVILFTSGTESYPKAVPLSHNNILSNHRGSLEAIKLNTSDILYGVLPPFHSFGFSVTGLLPLLSGLRVFYAPDPTDAHAMAQDCFSKSITMIGCAPSFYRNLFHVASPIQLQQLRLIVSGAEKAHPELFEYAKKYKKLMIEGYGITECSPIVSINKLEGEAKGVGFPLSNVKLCVIHPETQEKLSQGKQGEICIMGPGVFQGYLGKNVSNPFVEIDGKKWYKSGDIGRVNNDGSLVLEGRLKRFVKIGGEMVSLVALEEEITRYVRQNNFLKDQEDKTPLAMEVKEGEKPALILFVVFSISKEKVNQILHESGFPRLVKVFEVRKIDEIPMTGTGKIQLRQLKELINA